MAKWTDHLFDTLASRTDMGEETLKACRRILVPHVLPDGSVGVEKRVDVAKEFGFQASHMSRSVANLQQRLIEFGDLSNERELGIERGLVKAQTEASRDVAIDRAREMVPNLAIREAQAGQTYIGRPLVRTDQHLVQVIAPGEAVLHDLKKLQRVPDMNFPMLEVRYPARGGLAAVQETLPDQTRGGRSR